MAERRYPPFPPGKYDEFAAAISEGFCPSCLQPLDLRRSIVALVTWAFCLGCECAWEHDRLTYVPVVRWTGVVKGAWMVVFTCSNGHLIVHTNPEGPSYALPAASAG